MWVATLGGDALEGHTLTLLVNVCVYFRMVRCVCLPPRERVYVCKSITQATFIPNQCNSWAPESTVVTTRQAPAMNLDEVSENEFNCLRSLDEAVTGTWQLIAGGNLGKGGNRLPSISQQTHRDWTGQDMPGGGSLCCLISHRSW